MKVYRDEGVATHISPEPCVAVREGRREASVGKTYKPAIVPRNAELVRDADREAGLEGNPWPNQRFAVKHPRWEPSARIVHARI